MNRFTMTSAVLGFMLLVTGAGWIYRPLAPVLAGILLIAVSFMSARRKG